MRYKGWVPTVNGRLSFKLIGETRYPSDAVYANALTPTHHYVLAYQRRNLSDVLFEPVLGPMLQVSGKFDFVFCARARRHQSDAPLIGRVYASLASGKNCLRKLPALHRALEELRDLDFASGSQGARKIYAELHTALSLRSAFYADIVLHRNGVISVSRLRWVDKEMHDLSNHYVEGDVESLTHSVADQLYFFVRDISHQHQHHSPDADTIITTEKDIGGSLSWAASVAFSLYYYIITIKRRADPAEHVRALGVLAYLRAFKSIISQLETRLELSSTIPYFDDEASKDSITATRNYIELLGSRKRTKSDSFRTVLFAVVAMMLTLFSFISGFADAEIEPVPPLTDIANFLRMHAYLSLLPPIILLLWWLSNALVVPKYDFKRDVIRLALAQRGTAVTVLLVLSAGLAVAAYFLGFAPLSKLLAFP